MNNKQKSKGVYSKEELKKIDSFLENLTPCPYCYCMTYMIKNICGKCGMPVMRKQKQKENE